MVLLADVVAPYVPRPGEVLSLYARRRGDGYVTVTVDHWDAGGEECEGEPCVVRLKYYLPAWLAEGRRGRRQWLSAVETYVGEVARAVERAASAVGEPHRSALLDFHVRVRTSKSGRVLALGIEVGRGVVELGPPPEPLYDLPLGGWFTPTDYSYVHSVAWTYYWRIAIERVLGRNAP